MLMLKGSLQLGLLPRLAVNYDLMPVDFFARFSRSTAADLVRAKRVQPA